MVVVVVTGAGAVAVVGIAWGGFHACFVGDVGVAAIGVMIGVLLLVST
jgi:hypothetical protein